MLREAGLINTQGTDALYQRIVFPLRQGEQIVNLYGRSIGASFAHRFLPGGKGGLYAWEKVRRCSEVILVEGLFDYAALRQAGFSNLTCSLGTHLNADQFRQLITIRASSISLSTMMPTRVAGRQQNSWRINLPSTVSRLVAFRCLKDDRNSFFAGGGGPHQFQDLLEAAQPSSSRDLNQDCSRGTQPLSRRGAGLGPRGRLDQRYLDREYVRRLASKSLYSYAHSLLHFVRWWEGVHHTGDISEETLPNRPCSTTSASGPVINRRRLPPPSTIAWLVPIALSVMSSPMLPVGPSRLSSGLLASQAAGPRPPTSR